MKLILDLPIDAMPNGIATLMPRSTVATTATKKHKKQKKKIAKHGNHERSHVLKVAVRQNSFVPWNGN